MTLYFPATPSIGDVSLCWTWDGSKWRRNPDPISPIIGDLTVDGNIYSTGTMNPAGGINAQGAINTSSTVNADGIYSGGDIGATGNITATGSGTFGTNVSAGNNITAGGSVYSGYGISLGDLWWYNDGAGNIVSTANVIVPNLTSNNAITANGNASIGGAITGASLSTSGDIYGGGNITTPNSISANYIGVNGIGVNGNASVSGLGTFGNGVTVNGGTFTVANSISAPTTGGGTLYGNWGLTGGLSVGGNISGNTLNIAGAGTIAGYLTAGDFGSNGNVNVPNGWVAAGQYVSAPNLYGTLNGNVNGTATGNATEGWVSANFAPIGGSGGTDASWPTSSISWTNQGQMGEEGAAATPPYMSDFIAVQIGPFYNFSVVAVGPNPAAGTLIWQNAGPVYVSSALALYGVQILDSGGNIIYSGAN